MSIGGVPQGASATDGLTRSDLGTRSAMANQRAGRQNPPPRSRRRKCAVTAACVLLASTLPISSAQSCISLASSRACSAFNASSVSTGSAVVGLFPFLSDVTNTASFDSGLENYIANGFTQLRYAAPQSIAA